MKSFFMFKNIISSVIKGLTKVRNNPQLFYTVFVAVIIIAAFLFMANRFISIATDAGDRLVNVRIGSLQDSFVSFAADRIDDTEYINRQISTIKSKNETIKNFLVVKKIDNDFIIIASDNPGDVGRTYNEAEFLYNLATGNSNDSLTAQFISNGERMFSTARAITDSSKNVLGVVMTNQTLSEADMKIERNVNNSLILLFVVIAVIILLFLRYSKVVDYMHLYQKLQEVDQLKDDFISMASHELRTPLTAIRGYAELMRDAPELADGTREYSNRIDISAKELDSIISDILDVSRIQQGRMSYNFEKVRPKEIINEVMSALMKSAKDKNLDLSFDSGEENESWTISADKVRLKQVIMNLIGNAIKYTPSGSIRVSETVKNGSLTIRVQDTGLGISAAEREHLFEKFYRIRTKETQEIRGTGLGLWITAKMVKDMKGEIAVESIKGVGSHFVINFPLIK